MPTKKIVERCFLMNLDRRDDRLREWMQQLPQPWPFPDVERFAAIDGRKLATPEQWRAGNGAWGCYRSHLLILEKCLLEGIDSYVVFEDDAGFVPDFVEHLEAYVRELPEDWGLAYLGGQHLYAAKHPPKRISDRVYRPYNVNRTHAFMVRGRATMKALYRHLNWNDWHLKHHIDHHLGRLTQRRYEALVQVRMSRKSRSRFTHPIAGSSVNCRPNPISAVASGPKPDSSTMPRMPTTATHRSSPSSGPIAVAQVASQWSCIIWAFTWATNSVAMRQPGEEAIGLAQLCEKAMRFPATDPKTPDAQLSKQLKAWIVARKAEAIRDRTVAGGKYPHLCRFANHLYEALGNSLRIIAVDRPIEASIRSLQDRSSRHPGQWFAAGDDACEKLQRSLLEHREKFIQEHPEVPVHRINFARLTEDPETVINELIAFLGIEPTAEEIDSAIAHVNPELRKFG